MTTALCVALSGCATDSASLLPHGDETMKDLWKEGTSTGGDSSDRAGAESVNAARSELRRPISSTEMVGQEHQYTRTAKNEIDSQFSCLPNPDMTMYVYPHLQGTENVPVPGYSTIFPLYSKPQYAMPGETARPIGRTR
ncbi:TIGR03751 family conjugal transfer lipoprotein [Carnimonas bestiolae]|uniref:TIGR03751 family conjugal transfer lipoprotein n=1 Tax=Carnimonas bestiolae TaxID=3402172 RepID=UPI003F4AAFF1